MNNANWILREGESNISLQDRLGQGGYGEVHKVRPLQVHANRKMIDNNSGKVLDFVSYCETFGAFN
jgi:hypothetical protein